ncbi:hypothetical protein [Leptospira sp. GIMC2001]|uniref:hypothetical protein n=1 Tax=Leptospira sp. GIMC2001 TaxID=1513297 RepID=UPI00234AFAB2|nr:hypothetical protein [Leptospira sp. GIMC2001]WCL51505.1 hypothetical protein O4O04_20020 [Leptospira sp. GIMC2001]
MPRQFINSGSNPFQTELGPSAFNPNPPDDLINRQGERAIWLRALPPPSKMQTGRMLGEEDEPWMYRIDRVRRMPQETIINQHIEGLDLFTKFGPISKVRDLYMFRNEDYGGNVHLEVEKFSDNRITIKPNPEFVPDYEFQCDYEVETFERRFIKPFIQTKAGRNLFLDTDELIVKIHSVHRHISGTEQFELLADVKTDLTKIILPQASEAGREFILDITTFSPISIGYRTIDARDKRLSDKSGLSLVAGDLDLVVPTNINLSKDDILIPLNSLNTEKEWIQRGEDGRFPIKLSPVREVYAIYSDTEEFHDFEIEDFRFLKINEQTPDNLMIVYGYNPRFRVLPESTISAIARKVQPRKYNARLDQTSLDLGNIFEEILK